ncbi:hypothetical protein [Gordonia effusa]|nr:hypothetical protein [Gordonia effusa]
MTNPTDPNVSPTSAILGYSLGADVCGGILIPDASATGVSAGRISALMHLADPKAQTYQVGDRVRFIPRAGDGTRWWTVRASNEQYLVATRQAEFRPKGKLLYTVVDLVGWEHSYNNAGPGLVRSSLNTLGGGWELGPDGEGAQGILDVLVSGKWELSRRRAVSVTDIEVAPR